MWTVFSFYWISYNIAPVVCVWIFGWEAYGIIAPWTGIRPASSALEGEILTVDLQGNP